MKKLIYTCALLISLVFLSCATSKVGEGELNPVYVTNSKKISLLPPTALSRPLQTYQLIEGQFGKDSFTMMAYIEIVPEGIFISLLNDFGTDMGTISYDGSKVFFESPYFPKNLKGEYVISDIQNVYYDVDLLKENYSKAGLEFKVNREPGKVDETTGKVDENGVEVDQIRQIYSGDKLIEEIRFEGNSVTIKNFLRKYEYILTDGGIVE